MHNMNINPASLTTNKTIIRRTNSTSGYICLLDNSLSHSGSIPIRWPFTFKHLVTLLNELVEVGIKTFRRRWVCVSSVVTRSVRNVYSKRDAQNLCNGEWQFPPNLYIVKGYCKNSAFAFVVPVWNYHKATE